MFSGFATSAIAALVALPEGATTWKIALVLGLLVFAPPAKHAKIKKQLSRLIHVPFKFEFGGSQVIFHEVEEDYSAHDKARDKQQIEAFRELDADAPGAS